LSNIVNNNLKILLIILMRN